MQLKEILDQRNGWQRTGNLYEYPLSSFDDSFESRYLLLRQAEDRMYDDELLRSLPNVPSYHMHRKEWAVREHSSRGLVDYINQKWKSGSILEVGCGNGWLSHLLAQATGLEVLGVDVNRLELLQANRVFDHKRLSFALADINDRFLPANYFDVIVLASVIAYFPDIDLLVKRLRMLLKEGGEIHIIDSPFSSSVEESRESKRRSAEHFRKMGVAGMESLYHHHIFSDVVKVGAEVVYNPASITVRLRRKLFREPLSPFPWLRIR